MYRNEGKMKRNMIKPFSDNIRHMFILYAIIPVFLITCACMSLFFGIWQYAIYSSNSDANKKVSKVLEETLDAYTSQVRLLSQDASLITEGINTDKLVEIRRGMYQLSSETNCSANLYILDKELKSVLPDYRDMAPFLIDPSCYKWGIIREISEDPQNISIKLAQEDTRVLCIGSGIQKSGKLVGYVVITIPANEFQLLLTQVSPQTMITDQNGWTYLTNNYNFQDKLGRFDRDLTHSKGFIQYQNHWYYLSQNTICKNELHIYTITDHEIQTRMFFIMGLFILVIFIGIIIITYFISTKVATKSTRDIKELAKAFEQVKKGNLERYLDIDSSVEFKEIGEAYNIMLEGLKKNMKENKELIEHVAFAQVKQLEAQFNPHFIFNTLDNIRFMCKIDTDITDDMIVALSSLLRYSISNAEEEIEVAEDIQYTENYLTILKLRFNRKFTYKIDVEDKIKNYLIPKLMMQSLIENAVKYGYSGAETLNVSIKGYEEAGKLIFICKDNGIGIDEELLRKIRENLLSPVNKSNHLGIYNIHRRIQLMYHGDYGVSLASKVGEGTIVTLTLPIRMKEDL